MKPIMCKIMETSKKSILHDGHTDDKKAISSLAYYFSLINKIKPFKVVQDKQVQKYNIHTTFGFSGDFWRVLRANDAEITSREGVGFCTKKTLAFLATRPCMPGPIQLINS